MQDSDFSVPLGQYSQQTAGRHNRHKQAGNKSKIMRGDDITERSVMELRRKGLSFRRIGEELGIPTHSAWSIYDRVMKRDYEYVKDIAMSFRQEEMERLEEQLEKLLVRQEIEPDNLGVVDKILKVMERKSKLLGLDAPVKTETNVSMSLSHEQALEQLARDSA